MRTAVHSQWKRNFRILSLSLYCNLSLIYEGAIGQPKKTTSFCDPWLRGLPSLTRASRCSCCEGKCSTHGLNLFDVDWSLLGEAASALISNAASGIKAFIPHLHPLANENFRQRGDDDGEWRCPALHFQGHLYDQISADTFIHTSNCMNSQ